MKFCPEIFEVSISPGLGTVLGRATRTDGRTDRLTDTHTDRITVANTRHSYAMLTLARKNVATQQTATI